MASIGQWDIYGEDGIRQDVGGGRAEEKGAEKVFCFFYQTTEDEEDHEQASQSGFCIDVSVDRKSTRLNSSHL